MLFIGYAQSDTRIQKSLLFAWPLENRVKLQWRTQRRKLCYFSIAITTVINAIQNISGLNVECRMSTGCNTISDWRSSAIKQLPFFVWK